ncbi:MAG: hypothetical protein HQ546_01965 [Planctomycetes bacterium]|nr:hypothetical protein [Planctomycetota bacterium]
MGRRRGGAVISALVLIGLLTYGWLYFTNDNRIRRKAEAYLRQLTGGAVQIDKASFSLFDGIKLTRVRLFYRRADRTAEELFSADQVMLQHEPLSLLKAGKLAVTEVVCIRPVITVTQDVDCDRWNYQRLFGTGQSGLARIENLPIIRLVDGQLCRNEIVAGVLAAVSSESLTITARPQADKKPFYTVSVASEDSRGEAIINVATGKLTWSGLAPLQTIGRALPRRYRQWYERYQVSGRLTFEGCTDPESAVNTLAVRLEEASMTLPAEEGALTLADLSGRVVLTDDGVTIDELKGQLPDLAGAKVRTTGRIDGYGPESDFHFAIEIEALPLPVALGGETRLGRLIEKLQHDFSPTGSLRLLIEIDRKGGGPVRVSGEAWPQRMSVTVASFPYRVDDLGTDGEGAAIVFDGERVRLGNLTGRHGAAKITAGGEIFDPASEPVFDLHITARDLAFDSELRSALNRRSREVYDSFSPAGRGDADVRVYSPIPGMPPQADVTITLSGQASTGFNIFPGYRMDELFGRIDIAGDAVVLDSLRGRCGQAEIRLDGQVQAISDVSPGYNLQLHASDVPLEEKLISTFLGDSESSRSAAASLGMKGMVDIDGTVEKKPGEPLDYELTIALKGVDLKHTDFGYPLCSTTGLVQLTPRKLSVERITGRCADGPMSVVGEVMLDRRPVGLDLTFEGAEVALNESLRAALPPEAAEVWGAFRPAGTADVRLHLSDSGGAAGGYKDYSLDLTAKDLAVTCRAAGNEIHGLRGSIHIEPDLAVLENLTAVTQQHRLQLIGRLIVTPDGIELQKLPNSAGQPALIGKAVPIDTAFIEMASSRFPGLSEYLSPGGRCDVVINELVCPRRPATQPSSQPATSAWGQWRMAGRIDLAEANMAGPFGRGQASGWVSGLAIGGESLSELDVDAQLHLDRLVTGGREIRRLTGRVRKVAGASFIAVKNLEAEFSGGKIEGAVELAIGDPKHYGLEFKFEGLGLAGLLSTSAQAPEKRPTTSGDLAGRLRLGGILGQKNTREGRGQLQITNADIAQVPVLLGLMDVVFLKLPTSSTFTSGQVEYLIKADRVIFSNIYLKGPNASIIGSGTMHMTGDWPLELVFVSGQPSIVPGVFQELFRHTNKDLLSFHVTGTLGKPRSKSVPFGRLQGLLREMTSQ